MEHPRALFLIFFSHCVGLGFAVFPRKYASGIQLETEAVAKQPRRLVRGASADPSVSLLEIMQGLQTSQRRPAAVAAEVQVERRVLSGGSSHERELLADMGHLEGQLESWRQAEQSLEQQVTQQEVTVDSLKGAEAKAIHDEQVAAVVWWDCKMLLCMVITFAIALCAYSTTGAAQPQTLKPIFSGIEQFPEPVPKVVRATPESVEKDAKREAEDVLQVTLAVPKPSDVPDLEAPTALMAVEISDLEANIVHEVIEEIEVEAPVVHAKKRVSFLEAPIVHEVEAPKASLVHEMEAHDPVTAPEVALGLNASILDFALETQLALTPSTEASKDSLFFSQQGRGRIRTSFVTNLVDELFEEEPPSTEGRSAEQMRLKMGERRAMMEAGTDLPEENSGEVSTGPGRQRSPSECSNCQFFALEEEPQATPATAEDSWWD